MTKTNKRMDDDMQADDPMSDFFLDKPFPMDDKRDMKIGKSSGNGGNKKAPAKI